MRTEKSDKNIQIHETKTLKMTQPELKTKMEWRKQLEYVNVHKHEHNWLFIIRDWRLKG